MGEFHEHRFPGESDAYRQARDRLLAAEAELRNRTEAVAALRRGLPRGGRLAEDYVFDEAGAKVRFSELFAEGKDSLVLYSFMYAPDAETPCPMCTSMLDSLDGSAPHIRQQVNLVVVAKARIFASHDHQTNGPRFRMVADVHDTP